MCKDMALLFIPMHMQATYSDQIINWTIISAYGVYITSIYSFHNIDCQVGFHIEGICRGFVVYNYKYKYRKNIK